MGMKYGGKEWEMMDAARVASENTEYAYLHKAAV